MKTEIVIIGAAILDVLVRPADEQVFRTGSSPAEEIRMSTGADALNEASVLAALGKNVRLETVIGDDQAGKFIQNFCREKGIELGEHCVKKNLATGINVVLIDREGERHFLTNPAGSLRKLTLEDISMPFPDNAGILCFASVFVFPQIGAAELEQIFRQAASQGMTVCADLTKRKNGETVQDLAPALRYVDYLFPNEEEAMLLTGEHSAETAAEKLFEAGVKHVVIKCGTRGCYVKTDKESVWVPAVREVECVDTTGAGDSFAAGFLAALSDGKTVIECAEAANVCGAGAVGSVGATDWAFSGK